MSDVVTITGVTIGNDSKSGAAYLVTDFEDGKDRWVPYSVTERRTLSKVKACDSIYVQAWWARKEEIAE